MNRAALYAGGLLMVAALAVQVSHSPWWSSVLFLAGFAIYGIGRSR